MRKNDESILFFQNSSNGLLKITYEDFGVPLFHGILGYKLRCSEVESCKTELRYTHRQVFDGLRQSLLDVLGEEHA